MIRRVIQASRHVYVLCGSLPGNSNLPAPISKFEQQVRQDAKFRGENLVGDKRFTWTGNLHVQFDILT
jgi:hypothetical protein